MKRIFIVVLVFACLFIVGCEKKESINNNEIELTGGWEIVLSNQVNDLHEEDIKIFNNAKSSYKELKLDLVALLGKQVVAGMNYMFLAKGYQSDVSKATYKIVVVYHNLEGKDSITKVNDFDYTRYVNTNIDGLNEELSGGWNVESSGRPYTLFEEKDNNVFDKATNTLAGMSFKPLVLLGTQVVAGTNYAVLCYGSATVPDAKEGIYLLTLYEDLEGNGELISTAYIDLANYNK